MRVPVVASVLGIIVAAACAPGEATRSPVASFLVVAGDSTYWVTTDSTPPAVRRSPIFLAHLEGRFVEIYLADDDRSYYDAVIVGHRVFRRDIVRGDSAILFEDSTIASIAEAYAASHPGERPLAPGEDEADDPGMVSTSETEILDVVGPFVTLERHVDLDLPGGGEKHETRRSVIDMRTGKGVTLADLMPDSLVEQVLGAARRAQAVAFDSVRRSTDARAHAATAMLRDFVFDPTSFTLTTISRAPAVAFLLPGRGLRAGGYALPLPPITILPGSWWAAGRDALPNESTADEDFWRGPGYDVGVRYEPTSSDAQLLVRLKPGSWTAVTRVPTPVQRVIRLDAITDPAVLQALARAFDEAAHYSKPLRTTQLGSDTNYGLPAAWTGRP